MVNNDHLDIQQEQSNQLDLMVQNPNPRESEVTLPESKQAENDTPNSESLPIKDDGKTTLPTATPIEQEPEQLLVKNSEESSYDNDKLFFDLMNHN